MVMHLDEQAVRSVLRWDRLIAAMETALTAFSGGRVIQPTRNMITIEEGKRYLGIMPAVAREAMGAAGREWIEAEWTWDRRATELRTLLAGP